ncbi:MAG: DoxX subfamily [Bacteroides sp. SM23_62_1]|nr:MAG: DoxX subfamily [Bacteroides sp. SM23_62_1]
MTNTGIKTFSSWQLTALVLLRVAIGWNFLYEGLAKLTDPDWTAMGFLMDSKWIFSGIFQAMAANQSVLAVVDFLNIWGLILIGLGLILGVFTRVAAISGVVLLAFYFLSHPPMAGLRYAIPSEGNYLIVNKTLIQLIAVWTLYLLPTGRIIGIDRFIFGRSGNE